MIRIQSLLWIAAIVPAMSVSGWCDDVTRSPGWFAGQTLRYDGGSNNRGWRNPLSGCGVHWLLETRIKRSDVAVVVRRSDGNDRVACEVVVVLKNSDPSALQVGDTVMLDPDLRERPERLFVAYAMVEGESLGVIEIDPLTDSAFELVQSLTVDGLNEGDRFRLLIDAARGDDAWCKAESIAALDAITFDHLLTHAEAIPTDVVRQWAFSTESAEERRRAMMLLAAVGNADDARRLEQRLFADPSPPPSDVQVSLFAWLWLTDQRGRERFLQSFLFPKLAPLDQRQPAEGEVTFATIYAAYHALSWAEQFASDGRFDAAWQRASHHLVDDPLIADVVLHQFQKRGDWQMLSAAIQLHDRATDDYQRVALILHVMFAAHLSDDDDVRAQATKFLDAAQNDQPAAIERARMFWHAEQQQQLHWRSDTNAEDADEQENEDAATLHRSADTVRHFINAYRSRLTSDKLVVRWVAAAEIVELQLAEKALLPDLISRIDDSYPATGRLAIEALGHLGPAAAPATDRLLALIRTPKSPFRRVAIETLGRIEAKVAAADLAKCLDEDSVVTRLYAAEALWRIERSPAAVAVFVERVGKRSPCRGLPADKMLKRMAAESEEPIRALRHYISAHELQSDSPQSVLLEELLVESRDNDFTSED